MPTSSPEAAPSTSPSPSGARVVSGPARWFWTSCGFAAVGVGSVGVVVPGLPTTVFFIVAAWCFARSSPRFEAWVLDLPKVGPMVRDHRDGLGMPRRAKVVAISMIVLFSGVGAVLLWSWIGLVVLAAAVVGVLYVALRVPTREAVLGGPADREAARVLLVDGADRVLLFLADFGDGRGPCWFTPGGGLEPGESATEAAARELAEETGLDLPAHALGEPVWTRRSRFRFRDAWVLQDERYFHVRVDAHEVDTRGFDPEEASVMLDVRWWGVAELRDAEGLVVWPSRLAAHLDALLAADGVAGRGEPVALEPELDGAGRAARRVGTT